MNGTLAVASRELKEKWTVLVAALVAGVVALVVPLLSSLGRHDAREARELAALVLAAAFACGVAVVIGAGMITRELVERRHSFLFSRPLSAVAIWGGKVLAAWLLAVGSGVVVLLPATALSGGMHLLGSVAPWGDTAAMLGTAAVALLALVAISHAVAVMVRSRVPWLLALDAVAGVAVFSGVAWAAHGLYAARAGGAQARGLGAFAALVTAAALAAGFAQVARGRTDPARGHAALASVFWGALACGALLFGGYARWVIGATPHDLLSVGFVEPAPRGPWVALLGGRATARGDYYPTFLFDSASGRGVRIDTGNRWRNGVAFSGDGRLAAWLSDTEISQVSPVQVVTLDLAAPLARPMATTIILAAGSAYELVLSGDGRRVATVGREDVQVHELPSGRLVASARMADAGARRTYFLPGGDALRIETRMTSRGAGQEGWKEPAEVVIREFDLSSRSLLETGRIGGVAALSFWVMQHDREGRRTVVTTSESGTRAATLRDGRTGALLATLASAEAGEPRALFLGDGRIALIASGLSGARLRLFTAAGAAAAGVDLPPCVRASFAGEPAAGRVVVRTLATAGVAEEWNLSLVDTATGTSRRLASGHSPVGAMLLGRGEVETGSPGSRLFTTRDGGLDLLDPDAGSFRTLLHGRWKPE